MSDLVIRDATVLDGTGAPGTVADVTVTEGRIEAVGKGLTARRTLDAAGLALAAVNKGRAPELLALLDAAIADGCDLTLDT